MRADDGFRARDRRIGTPSGTGRLALRAAVASLTLLAPLLLAALVFVQAGFEDDRGMLQGFHWESYRYEHPAHFPELVVTHRAGVKKWADFEDPAWGSLGDHAPPRGLHGPRRMSTPVWREVAGTFHVDARMTKRE